MTRFDHLDPGVLDEATNILLVAPEVGQSVESLFSELLLTLESPPDHVVGVATSKSPRELLEPWQRSFPGTGTDFSFVSVDGAARSVAAGANGIGGEAAPEVTHVSDVTPVAAFGRAIADELSAEGDETAVCFHSITDLLEFVDEETAFDFLHVVLSRVRRTGARGVYHVDADVLEESTVVKLSTLFDLVVEFDSGQPEGGHGTTTGESP